MQIAQKVKALSILLDVLALLYALGNFSRMDEWPKNTQYAFVFYLSAMVIESLGKLYQQRQRMHSL